VPGFTAQQKLYAIELKRKSSDKKLDDVIVALRANYDRDVSASTLHAWLKPENATKIEQLVKRPQPWRFHVITETLA
jgi:hypothetical protein